MVLESVAADTVQFPRHSIMADEEFEAPPNWSDVEDDPEYDEVEGQPIRIRSDPSCGAAGGADSIFPAVYMPSGFPGGAVCNGVASKTKPDQERSLSAESWETEHSTHPRNGFGPGCIIFGAHGR